jgi:hypothetical protein
MDHYTTVEREELDRLLAQRDELVEKKQEQQTALTLIKNQVRGQRLSPEKYRMCLQGQSRRVEKLELIEKEIRAIKGRIRELTTIESERRKAHAEDKDEGGSSSADCMRLLDLVAEVRDEYRRFSADATRVSSMRRCAAEFANKLDEVMAVVRGA